MKQYERVFVVPESEIKGRVRFIVTEYGHDGGYACEQLKDVIVMTPDELKKFATDFFYWWFNQKGANTLQGYDEFLESKGIKIKR